MRPVSSLSNRIFLACTLLATLSLGFTFYFVNANVTSQAEAERSRRLIDAAELAQDQLITSVTDTFTRQARFVADLPTLKAQVDLKDPPTTQPLMEGYRTQLNADLLVVTSPQGMLLGTAGDPGASLAFITSLSSSSAEHVVFLPHSRGLLQIVSVPIQIVTDRTEILGRLTVGVFLDHERALQFKRLTNSDIAFGLAGRILASSLAADTHEALRSVMAAVTPTAVTLGDREYFGLARPVVGTRNATQATGSRPVVILLRPRDEGLEFLTTLQAGLAGALLVAVLLATVVSYVVARTITRPLAAVTGAMADVAATGDLSRRVTVQSRAWDDEVARLLAAAFNRLTESIAVFRRQETQRERLSSLGRLSTVVAHEIRNPLMIIRASLRALHRDPVSQSELREAVADIDEETGRLNRIVTEVLDFAKPIRFELAEASVNDICRASAAAAGAGSDLPITLDLDPDLPPIVTDAERLRTAFVNILTNARHAVEALPRQPVAAAPGGGPAAAVMPESRVTVRTRTADRRVLVTIADSGIGIGPEDMAHVFDPYFTTRRAGTGLGLPISKNIVEGLGGTIEVASRPGEGTAIQISLPGAGAGAAA
jgi:signal transduction histidine kinase